MGHDLDRRIARLAEQQHSVFVRAQARAVGFSDDQICYRIATERWLVGEPGLYSIAGATLTWESTVMGELLLSPPSAAAASRTAARLWRVMPENRGAPEILVPAGSYRRNQNVRTAVHLGPRDVRRIGPIRVTAPARTLADLAAILVPTQLEAALDEFIGLRLASVNAVRRYIDDRRLEHRPGVGNLRELLDDRERGVPQKELERAFLRLIRRFRLPEPMRQRKTDEYRVDFAYPDRKVLIEVDGWNFHRTPRSLDHDLRRQNALILSGWTVLRFTWKQVTQRPDEVAATIRASLSAYTL